MQIPRAESQEKEEIGNNKEKLETKSQNGKVQSGEKAFDKGSNFPTNYVLDNDDHS